MEKSSCIIYYHGIRLFHSYGLYITYGLSTLLELVFLKQVLGFSPTFNELLQLHWFFLTLNNYVCTFEILLTGLITCYTSIFKSVKFKIVPLRYDMKSRKTTYTHCYCFVLFARHIIHLKRERGNMLLYQI